MAVKSVEEYINNHPEQAVALEKLYQIIQSTSLQESIKWGAPVFTFSGKNIVGLGAFKSYTGLWFFQGVFLQDQKELLVNAQEGKTKAMRQMRFQDAGEIDEKIVRDYILEAIQNQKDGKEMLADRSKPIELCDEFADFLSANTIVAEAFDRLSKSKKRDYAEYIASAKQLKTKEKRLAKIKPMILEGMGLNDRYQ